VLVEIGQKFDHAVFLTGAGGSASENVLDSLEQATTRYRVIGADVSPIKLHLSSAHERCLVPLASDLHYLTALNSAIRHFDAQILHVQPDPEVRKIGANRSQIDAATFLPSDKALQIAGDKSAFAELMKLNEIPVPESLSFESREEIESIVNDMLKRHERIWIRARVGAGARGSLPVSKASQALAWIDWWCQEKGMQPTDFMAAEMLPGREFAFQSIWQNGKLIAGQARERVEYLYGFLTPSGQTSTPAVARTVSDTSITDLAIMSITALDEVPNGIYCADIKESASGIPMVTEINAGRFFTTSNFFSTAGLNMPDMAMRAAAGEQLQEVGLSPLDDDLYWIRMVDMQYKLVPGDQLDNWMKFD
jgi:carbamoyl-phosphate synthase large subunit